MTREEWMNFHGFDEEDMERIEHLVKVADGKIVQIVLAKENISGTM